MKLLHAYTLLFGFTCSMSLTAVAQKKTSEWQVGYYAPYLSNMGGTVGFAFDLKESGQNSTERKKSIHRFQLLTQLGYFSQLKTSNNIILNQEMVYRWNKKDKRFFLTSSIGAGYLLSIQRQDGTLNLGTGEISYRNDAFNYFLPNVNLGLGTNHKKHFGFYLKATYGRKLSSQSPGTAFMGISTGLILKFNSKD